MINKPSAILMGSKPGAAVALKILRARSWDVKAVVVSRVNPHPWVGGKTLGELADDLRIPVFVQSELPRDRGVDFVISYMFRYRVKPWVLALATRAAVNFHPGPLPEFGGWAFYSQAILEDASEYGCTCHHMDDGFDTGPILKVRRFPINAAAETAYSLERKTQREMILLFDDFCEMAESGGALPRLEQDPARMRYLSRCEFEALKRVPADAGPEVVDRYARAFWYPPYECAYLNIQENKIEILPALAKDEIARLLHADDFRWLQEAAARDEPVVTA